MQPGRLTLRHALSELCLLLFLAPLHAHESVVVGDEVIPAQLRKPRGIRPTVGDEVLIVKTQNTEDFLREGIGHTYKIVQDGHDSEPYRVDGPHGLSAWLHEGDVRSIAEIESEIEARTIAPSITLVPTGGTEFPMEVPPQADGPPYYRKKGSSKWHYEKEAIRPTAGDKVVMRRTENTRHFFSEGMDKEYTIVTDAHDRQPYQIEGSDQWFYEADVQLRVFNQKAHDATTTTSLTSTTTTLTTTTLTTTRTSTKTMKPKATTQGSSSVSSASADLASSTSTLASSSATTTTAAVVEVPKTTTGPNAADVFSMVYADIEKIPTTIPPTSTPIARPTSPPKAMIEATTGTPAVEKPSSSDGPRLGGAPAELPTTSAPTAAAMARPIAQPKAKHEADFHISSFANMCWGIILLILFACICGTDWRHEDMKKRFARIPFFSAESAPPERASGCLEPFVASATPTPGPHPEWVMGGSQELQQLLYSARAPSSGRRADQYPWSDS